MGGTEFPAADIVSGNNTYFAAETTTDIISSAKSYIPEMVWNDDTSSDSSSPLSAGGGGVSIYSPHPSWQTGTIGGVAIPTSSFRMVPDISLTASPNNAPFAFCTSDTTFWNTAANGGTAPYQQASCNDGLRDSASQLLTVGGGTSFDAPTFAGLVAIINQSQNSTGQGVVNSTLYSVAATTAYSTAFHDITSGGNQCTAGGSFCSSSGAAQYAAGAGYDEATGLGSVDFNNLMTAWTGSSGGGGGGGTGSGSFALTAANASVTSGSSTTSIVNARSQNSYAGTVAFTVTSTGSLLTYGCYTIGNTTVPASSTGTATLALYTSQSTCSGVSGAHSFAAHGNAGVATSRKDSPFGKTVPIGAAAFAGLLCVGFRKSRKAWTLFTCLILIALLGFAAGCGSNSGSSTTNSTSSTSTDVAANTYTVTVVGTDTTTSSITASTTFTLTVN
jgi:hypothetical protein